MQKIIRGSIMHAGKLLEAASTRNVFLITGSHYQLSDEFKNLGKENIVHYVKAGPNVEEDEVIEASDLFLMKPSSAIAAIGGGSVMDLAKAIIHRQIQHGKPAPFFLAAPTTAGSGSEATQFAVVYKSGKKYSLSHPALLPQAVILDAGLLIPLSSYLAASSGMDVLAQAIESLWNRNATDQSRQYAGEAIQIWNNFFLQFVKNRNGNSAEEMLWAAHLAGKAINITRTTGPHALSYYLTAHHGVPHGHAVALFLPLFFIYNKPNEELCLLLGVANYEEAKEKILHIMNEAGLATTLAGLKIDKTVIAEKLADEVNEERFVNNPEPFDRKKLIDLIIRYL